MGSDEGEVTTKIRGVMNKVGGKVKRRNRNKNSNKNKIGVKQKWNKNEEQNREIRLMW